MRLGREPLIKLCMALISVGLMVALGTPLRLSIITPTSTPARVDTTPPRGTLLLDKTSHRVPLRELARLGRFRIRPGDVISKVEVLDTNASSYAYVTRFIKQADSSLCWVGTLPSGQPVIQACAVESSPQWITWRAFFAKLPAMTRLSAARQRAARALWEPRLSRFGRTLYVVEGDAAILKSDFAGVWNYKRLANRTPYIVLPTPCSLTGSAPRDRVTLSTLCPQAAHRPPLRARIENGDTVQVSRVADLRGIYYLRVSVARE